MAQAPDHIADEPAQKQGRGWRNILARVAVLALILLLALVAIGWTQRTDIARNLIGDQLNELGIEATYVVEDIDTEKQVLTDILVGDPANPDLTIDRAEVRLIYGFGVPEIGRIILERPRLYGTLSDGKLSFGALDRALFSEDDAEPAALPELDVAINDGRARIDTDYGPIGIKLQGQGQINDGFAGYVAAVAPDLAIADCAIKGASAYGDILTDSGALALTGPLRLGSMRCSETGLSARALAWQTKIEVESDLVTARADGALQTGPLSIAAGKVAAASGALKVALRDGDVASDFDLKFDRIGTASFDIAQAEIGGLIRMNEGFSRTIAQANFDAVGLSVGNEVNSQLVEAAAATDGTLVAPLLRKLSTAVRAQLAGASMSGSLSGQITPDRQALTLPEVTLRGASGIAIASLSRGEYIQDGAATPRLAGNFRMAGQNLPQLAGRMERLSSGSSVFRLKMSRYSAGDSMMEIPELLLTQAISGDLTFGGSVLATGALPGGSARALDIPISGGWSSRSGLELWRACTAIKFRSLAVANLELTDRSITVCPASGRPIVSKANGDLRIVAGLPSLDLRGRLADTPITLATGPVGFAYPGITSAKDVRVTLGAGETQSRFAISGLVANFGGALGDEIAGTFDGAEIGLAAVPLDLTETKGEWSFADGIFAINSAEFRINDRSSPARFEPMPATDGTLTLENNVIVASASVRAPTNLAEVSGVIVRHSLDTGIGFADLNVEGLRFDESLQPTDLTPLALGVVANVEGVVTGTGRIDWNPDTISSSGEFSSQSLDLAAAFGPVQGASGTVVFSDLLSLTTAPDQVINVASINPGIEAKGGKIGFNLRDGQFLGVTGGEWPFMGGTLRLRPVELNLGVAETRQYILSVEGLDAALFIENLELGNLAATGIFDGELPLIFDEEGFGRIEGGALRSRAPGGNLSYVGELTYEDLSPIANYTFNTLRSLDYESMQVSVEGPLTGDILTQVRFDGVKQGEGTKKNFITKQIADLPIRLNVNIRAPFYKLATTMKSIYDPSTVRDPRDIGLLVDDGTRFVPPNGPQPPPPAQPQVGEVVRPSEPISELPIQTSDSEEMP